MKLIVCLDKRNGMAFNGRRQSRDRYVIGQIAKLCAGSVLWMHPNSAVLFKGIEVEVRSSLDYLHCASANEWCFAETEDVTKYLNNVQQIVVFRWKSAYPYDLKFPDGVLNYSFSLAEVCEFEGNSHSSIIMEVYTS